MGEVSPNLVGQTLGNWTLLRLLGEGGFGAVYEAQHTSISGRRAAVKVLHPHLAFHKDITRRFISEASIASQAEHQNIVQVFDGGVSSSGSYFVAMELLKGRSLADVLRSDKALDIRRTLSIALQIAGALDAAHSLGIVHRDLKPDNVFLTQRRGDIDFIKVLDFGIAKLQSQPSRTITGSMMGTPLYMSPEQWQTLPEIDGRADLYSLGVILFECLCGKPPFEGTTQYELMKAHVEGPIPELPRMLVLPEKLSRLIRRLLAKRPEERPASAAEVMAALREIQRDPLASESNPAHRSVDPFARTGQNRADDVSGRPANASLPRWKPVRRSRMPGLGAALGIIAVAGGVYLLIRRPAAPVEKSSTSITGPTDAKKSSGPRVTLPAELVALGPGRFMMGSSSATDPAEKPAHSVEVGRFALSQKEISMAEFRQFVLAEQLPPPWPWEGVDDFATVEQLPVNQVTHERAERYCRWRYRDLSGRLPTEAEWEFAARSAGTTLQLPWAHVAEAHLGSYVNAGQRPPRLVPVSSMVEARTAQGLLHVLGNVAEWTASSASAYPGGTLAAPPDSVVVRGGSAADPLSEMSTTARRFRAPTDSSPYIGFRCAASLP